MIAWILQERCRAFALIRTVLYRGFATLLIFGGLSLLFVGWVSNVTAPGGHVRDVISLELPNIDVGIGAWPALPGRAGVVELWAYPHGGEDLVILMRISGNPPLPVEASPAKEEPPPAPPWLSA